MQNDTVPAAGTGSDFHRRAFLHGLRRLSALPLIGGSIGLIGAPAAAAVPVTEELLDNYDCWLFYEGKLLHIERWGLERAKHTMDALRPERVANFFMPDWPARWRDQPQPSTRAALVMSAVGAEWKPQDRRRA